ncbi:MAG: tetratricopeptide repeat-containing protein kinase family protein, partial [Acidobacteriota bacterium]
GIAKLLDPQSGASHDGDTLYLTPEYAAPEQFLRGRLSVATDVFALGAILFELLTGRSLRRFEGASPPVWIDRVLNEKAPKPSAGVDDVKTRRRLQGDLDAIVGCALEADPERRYASARALGAEIERHLSARPVEARRGQRLYRAGRTLRRHWLGFGLGLLVTVGTVYRRMGLLEESQALLDLLPSPRELAADATAPTVTGAHILNLHGELADDHGDYEEARGHFAAALALLDRYLRTTGDTPAQAETLLVAELELNRGNALYRLGRFPEATSALRRALDVSLEAGDREYEAAALAALATAMHGGERYDEELLRRAIEIYRSPEADDPRSLAASLNNLAIHLMDTGEWREAGASLEELINVTVDYLGPVHPVLASRLINLARLRIDQGQFRLILGQERLSPLQELERSAE